MNKEKLINFFVILGIIMGIPSIIYLINNFGNLSQYDGEYYYFVFNESRFFTITGAIIYAWSVFLLFIIYIKLLKKSNEFKGIKEILFISGIIGLTFLVCLPNTSKDVFYYMGNGRIYDKYGENPYYVSVRRIGRFKQH